MPIYEYRCENCEERFEKRVRVGTPTQEIDCPKCGAFEAKRLFSIFAGRTGSRLGTSSSLAWAGTSSGGCSPRSGFS